MLAPKAVISRVYATTLVPARREETTEQDPENNGGREHDRHHDNYPLGSIAAGYYHTCGVGAVDLRVRCWGYQAR